MKNKRNNGLRMTCVLLMLLSLIFVGSAKSYADDENAPAAGQEVIEAPQADTEAEKADAEAEEANAADEEANAA
ncbi:MAG: hypothetical protein IIY43_04010, partial [Oscillospiraceae bacterium]|nr:hypothetical protein [Oscillospiraceae bacterium]